MRKNPVTTESPAEQVVTDMRAEDGETLSAIDGVDGSRSWHRNVPHRVLSHKPMKGAIHEGGYHCRP